MPREQVKKFKVNPVWALIMNYTVMAIALLVLLFMLTAMITMFHIMLLIYAVISGLAFYFSYKANQGVKSLISESKNTDYDIFGSE